MAQLYGKASEYLLGQKLLNKYTALWIVSFIFLATVGYTFSGLYFGFTWIWVWVASLIFVPVYFLIRQIANKYISKAYKYRKGIKGEDLVLKELLKLPDEYCIFRDVHLSGVNGDIDFVVVGPTGVFSIEVKNMKGEIGMEGKVLTVNNRPSNIIKQVEREYWGLHEYLLENTQKSIFISPIVVFVNGKFERDYGDEPVTEQIRVLNHYKLVEFLQTTFQKTNSEYIHIANLQLQRLVTGRV